MPGTEDTREKAISAIAAALGQSRVLAPMRAHLRQAAAVAYGVAEPLIAAEQQERDAQLAEQVGATYADIRPPGVAVGDGRYTHRFADRLRDQP